MNLQDDRVSATSTESSSETAGNLWCPVEAADPAPGNASDDQFVEKLAMQLDQWLHANGCRLTTTALAPVAPISTHIATNTTTHTNTHNL